MRVSNFEKIIRGFNQADVRYLLVGGMAVIAHGYYRTTVDLDFVIKLEPENVRRAMSALTDAGYRPKVPVRAESFADPALREHWIKDKKMVVFQLVSDNREDYPIDIFVAEPFNFDAEWKEARRIELAPDTEVPVLNLPRLLAMKAAAGRPNDLEDIRRLQKLFPDVKPAT